MTILKKAVSFHEEGHLASLLSVRVSTNLVIAAGLFCFMEIKPRHLKLSDFSALGIIRLLTIYNIICYLKKHSRIIHCDKANYCRFNWSKILSKISFL